MKTLQRFDFPIPYRRADEKDTRMSVLAFEHATIQKINPELDGVARQILTRAHNYLLREQTYEEYNNKDKDSPINDRTKLQSRGMSRTHPRYRYEFDLTPYKHDKTGHYGEAIVFGVPDSIKTFCEAYVALGGHADVHTAISDSVKLPRNYNSGIYNSRVTLLRQPDKKTPKGKNERGVDAVLRNLTNYLTLDDDLDKAIAIINKNDHREGFLEYVLDSPNLPLVLDLIKEDKLNVATSAACRRDATVEEIHLTGVLPGGNHFDIPLHRIKHKANPSWTHYLVPYAAQYDKRVGLLDALGYALRENLANRRVQTQPARQDLEDWDNVDAAEAAEFIEQARRELAEQRACAEREQKESAMCKTGMFDPVTGDYKTEDTTLPTTQIISMAAPAPHTPQNVKQQAIRRAHKQFE